MLLILSQYFGHYLFPALGSSVLKQEQLAAKDKQMILYLMCMKHLLDLQYNKLDSFHFLLLDHLGQVIDSLSQIQISVNSLYEQQQAGHSSLPALVYPVLQLGQLAEA
ncbi:MAG: hypothetical protein EZS28_054993 [Streblomastix strix]|uniref:Uncharacterized protein n=1 Tax=Streblomastix strix TaxID=222440 RepID=A0A5J4QBZ4_9EUKA|nr:MAG: hypothetical protein EZS28_054993 [Streblomastix strix]